MRDTLRVTKESYKQRIVNLIDLAYLELDEEAKGLLESVVSKCNKILKELETAEEK